MGSQSPRVKRGYNEEGVITSWVRYIVKGGQDTTLNRWARTLYVSEHALKDIRSNLGKLGLGGKGRDYTDSDPLEDNSCFLTTTTTSHR
jgi:hypothetical protein